MSKQSINNLINDFIDNEMKPLRDEIKSLQNQLAKAKGKEHENLTKQIRILRQCEYNVVADARNIQVKDYPTTQEVKQLYDNSVQQSKNAINEMNGDRSFATVILDTLKSIANFCIKMITFGYVPNFFSTTASNVENTTKEINASLDKLVDEINNLQTNAI